jgi:hypothetical protein
MKNLIDQEVFVTFILGSSLGMLAGGPDVFPGCVGFVAFGVWSWVLGVGARP